ncbi:MAG: HAD-IA family hydrolase [Candidatus Bathyarchaeia archaeon]
MPKLQAIIFDLDDTLYPEIEFVKSGFKAVSVWVEANLGIARELAFQQFLQLFAAGNRGNIFDVWLAQHSINSIPWLSQMVKVYRDHYPRIAPYRGVPQILSQLKQSYRLALVTDGYVDVQKRKLKALGLSQFFDVVIFTDEFGKSAWKPSIVPFTIVLKKLKICGAHGVYVADNPLKDFVGARAVGLWTIRVRHPDGVYSHLEPPSSQFVPDMEIRTLGEIFTALNKIECDKLL